MDYKTFTHTVRTHPPNIRIADYCGQVFEQLGSKSAAKKALKAGSIWLNGRLAQSADYVQTGDRIVYKPDIKKIKKYNLDVPIVYEDDFCMIVDKPGGIAVNGNRYKTIENVFANHLKGRGSKYLSRPIVIHRLDVPTKGLLMLAKTKNAQIQLSQMFQQRKIKKTYRAIVHNQTAPTGKIDVPIKGKKAISEYQTRRVVPSKKFKHLSLVDLHPITGRTHQLRIHMEQAGHLIVGDKLYGHNQDTILGKGLFLQASRLQFRHPILNKMIDQKLPIPNRFIRLLDREEERFKMK